MFRHGDIGEVYDYLVDIARDESLTHYQDVGDLIGLDMGNAAHRDQISAILGDISSAEHQQGRPMLSAVVVLSGPEMPGGGFFDLGEELGLFDGGDKLQFFAQELRRVHEFWRR